MTEVRIFFAFFFKVDAPDFTALAAFKACAFGSLFLVEAAAQSVQKNYTLLQMWKYKS